MGIPTHLMLFELDQCRLVVWRRPPLLGLTIGRPYSTASTENVQNIKLHDTIDSRGIEPQQ